MSEHRFTRRRWLKSAAAAAVGAPYVIASTALGNAETPPASERVVLGHIGVGNRGVSLMQGFQTCQGAVSVACVVGPGVQGNRQRSRDCSRNGLTPTLGFSPW